MYILNLVNQNLIKMKWKLPEWGDKSLACYLYGSKIYCTVTPKSDTDYIYILPDGIMEEDEYQEHDDIGDITYYSESKWLKMIHEHHITALECIFSFQRQGKINYANYFKLDLTQLRKSISATCSNSWVKAKKKMTVEKDYDLYKAKKSLFHAIRIYHFGSQIAQYGCILQYTALKTLWDEIYNDKSTDYNHYKEKYQPIFNDFRSEFVKLAPKETIK